MLGKAWRFAVALGLVVALTGGGAFAVEFKPYARGSFAELRKQHAGRPLVVHFWSVTCPPCLAELPEWGKIAGDRKSVDFVFVNADHETDRPRAQARVEKAGLSNLPQYGFADDFVDRLYFEADKSWRGELPFTALIGPDGGVVTVTGAFDDPLIANWLANTGK